MTKGKVVLVPFPFDDLSTTRVRPAVCLTDPIGAHRHVVLTFVTSQIAGSPTKTDLVLDSGAPGFSNTGLRVSSMVCLHRLMTITTSLIQRELGELSPRMQADASSRLRELFSL